LQTRSVSLAMQEQVRVQVLSSFIDEGAPAADTIPGTMIVSDEELEGLDMERQVITGIAADKNEATIVARENSVATRIQRRHPCAGSRAGR